MASLPRRDGSRQHPFERNKKPWGINPRVFCFVEMAGRYSNPSELLQRVLSRVPR